MDGEERHLLVESSINKVMLLGYYCRPLINEVVNATSAARSLVYFTTDDDGYVQCGENLLCRMIISAPHFLHSLSHVKTNLVLLLSYPIQSFTAFGNTQHSRDTL
jgi:hypothetical protein